MTEYQKNVDELLNGFIDGELTLRQQTELQRLISHDAAIAQRMTELKNCKMLLNSLPSAKAPPDMLERVRTSMKTVTPITTQTLDFDKRAGARHLFGRKLVSFAAMIGLVAILGTVIYTIVGPESVPEKSAAVKDWQQPLTSVRTEKTAPDETVKDSVIQAAIATAFSARLELKTNNVNTINAVISRAISDNIPSDQQVLSVKSGTEGPFVLNCSRENLALFLEDLEYIWHRVDSTALIIRTGQQDSEVVVDAVNVDQIIKIAVQSSPQKRIEMARDFAVLNSVTERLPGREILAAISEEKPDLMTIPKPVLTSSHRKIKSSTRIADDEQKIRLSIVVKAE